MKTTARTQIQEAISNVSKRAATKFYFCKRYLVDTTGKAVQDLLTLDYQAEDGKWRNINEHASRQGIVRVLNKADIPFFTHKTSRGKIELYIPVARNYDEDAMRETEELSGLISMKDYYKITDRI